MRPLLLLFQFIPILICTPPLSSFRSPPPCLPRPLYRPLHRCSSSLPRSCALYTPPAALPSPPPLPATLQVAPRLPNHCLQRLGWNGGAHSQRHQKHGSGWLPPQAPLISALLCEPASQAASQPPHQHSLLTRPSVPVFLCCADGGSPPGSPWPRLAFRPSFVCVLHPTSLLPPPLLPLIFFFPLLRSHSSHLFPECLGCNTVKHAARIHRQAFSKHTHAAGCTKSQAQVAGAASAAPANEQLGRRLEGCLQGGQACQQLGPLILRQADALLPRQHLPILLIVFPAV